MNFTDPRYWPLWVAFALMFYAAIINYRTLTCPNWLSFGAILAALVVAAQLNLPQSIPAEGSLGAMLVAMLLGGLMLIPLYSVGGLGAGCVKMQAAFGAWLGCALPFAKALVSTAVSTIAGVVVTLIAASLAAKIISLTKKNRNEEYSNEVYWSEENPNEEHPEEIKLFPAQVTLSIGSVAALVIWLTAKG